MLLLRNATSSASAASTSCADTVQTLRARIASLEDRIAEARQAITFYEDEAKRVASFGKGGATYAGWVNDRAAAIRRCGRRRAFFLQSHGYARQLSGGGSARQLPRPLLHGLHGTHATDTSIPKHPQSSSNQNPNQPDSQTWHVLLLA